MNKEKRKKLRKNTFYKYDKEENNCMLYSINYIFPRFTFKENLKILKNKTIGEQILIINERLRKNNKILVQKMLNYGYLADFINDRVDNCIVILWNTLLSCHSEGILKGKFSKHIQPILNQYFDEKIWICMYELIEINIQLENNERNRNIKFRNEEKS